MVVTRIGLKVKAVTTTQCCTPYDPRTRESRNKYSLEGKAGSEMICYQIKHNGKWTSSIGSERF